MQMRRLQCFAFGRGDHFEAICVDLDIAVTGTSFQEVFELLNHAIGTYIEDALKEDPVTAGQLLNRRAPWHVRVWHRLHFTAHLFLNRRRKERQEASFDFACPA